MHTYCLVLLLASLCCTVTAGPTTTTAPAKGLSSVVADNAGGKAIALAGVTVRCTKDNGRIGVELTGPQSRLRTSVERSATIYVSYPTPQYVLILDQYASDEDRLLVYDLTKQEPKQALIEHDRGDDYVHMHFEIDGLTDAGVSIREIEYAGTAAPRTRLITLFRSGEGFATKVGSWTVISTR